MNKHLHIILYDGECSFCSYWVKFVLERDKQDQFRFTSLQSEKGQTITQQHNIPSKVDSVILLSNNHILIKSNAVFEILRLLGGWRKVFLIFKIFPRFIRDIVYDGIAKSRYKLFKRISCELPLDKNYKNKFF